MSRFIYDETEYAFGSKWFAAWHRAQDDDDAGAIDIDLCGYCKRCNGPLYLVEATRARNRKNATVLEHLGQRSNLPVWVVYQDKTGAHPGEILVDDRSSGRNYGWIPETSAWRMLQDMRRLHAHETGCLGALL